MLVVVVTTRSGLRPKKTDKSYKTKVGFKKLENPPPHRNTQPALNQPGLGPLPPISVVAFSFTSLLGFSLSLPGPGTGYRGPFYKKAFKKT
jgi:hypothetical protein